MNAKNLPEKGTVVRVRYIPTPYLGRGIVEPKEIEGVICDPRITNGKTYVVLKDSIGGKLTLEKEIGDLEWIKVAGAPEQQAIRMASEQRASTENRRTNYNRV